MIEVPASAVTADLIAKEVDFVSIGTNDLVQYTIAVDRNNQKIAYLYDNFHPGVIRLIKGVVDSCRAYSKVVHVCGEMAADPMACVLLGVYVSLPSYEPDRPFPDTEPFTICSSEYNFTISGYCSVQIHSRKQPYIRTRAGGGDWL